MSHPCHQATDRRLNARTLQENLVPPTVIVQDTSDAVIAPKVVQPVLPAEAAKVLV